MASASRVLIVDTHAERASALQQRLTAAGFETTHATSMAAAVAGLECACVDVIIITANRPIEIAPLLAVADDASVVVQVEPAGDPTLPRVAWGANDVVPGDATTDVLASVVDRAAHDSRLRRELALLRARAAETASQALIGRSGAMKQLRELIGRAAASQRTVLIVGEAGAGKDVVARLVHDLSERTARPYLRVRCSGTSADQLEEELFGSASIAEKLGRAGLLETARGGSVVLDECTALTPALRQRVARAIVDGAAPRVGGGAPVSLDVRYLLTTRDPEAMGARGTMSEALLSGVSVLPIVIPPLRERRSDIPLLVQHFRARLSREQGLPTGVPDAVSMMSMLAEQWPGNVRELEHRVERDTYGASEALPASASPRSTGTFAVPSTARWTLEQLERRYIEHVLMQVEGNQSRAAVRLGIDRRTLYRKLKDYRNERVELSQAG